jgi:hypothetical protein
MRTTVPPVSLPAPATAQLLSVTSIRAAADGTLMIGDLASTWQLTLVRPEPLRASD